MPSVPDRIVPVQPAFRLALALEPLFDVRDPAAQQAVRDRAVLATGCAFTLADARDPDLRLIWVNPAFTSTTGYPAAEALGRNCRFLQGPATDREQVGRLRNAVAAGREATVVLLNYRKDGTAFWNEVTVSPVLDDEGVLTHIVGVQIDVSDRVQVEHDLQAALAAERVARTDAERAHRLATQVGRRLTLLAEATSLLSATLDVEESLDRLARLVIPLLADWVVITLADDTGRAGLRSFARHRDGRHDLLARYAELMPAAVSPGTPSFDLLAGGPPMLFASFEPPAAEGLTPPLREIREISLALGATSLAVVPLTARRRIVGTMMLVQGQSGRVFDEDDLDLAADLGRRAGLAVDNARLYTREHETALALQRSLLPSALPTVPGLRFAAEYLPAGQDAQVGGDWWDVFPLPDGATGLAIGDVMGHDIIAAAAMGQLRSVLRTCAWAGDDPATVLHQMDRLVQGFDMAQLATCIYGRLSAADGPGGRRRQPRLTWSNAGHLPPVLRPPDGPAGLLLGSVGVPIGVPGTEPRTHQDVSLPGGSTLLLYTDGLVETRTGDIDSDVAALVARVRDHRPGDGPRALLDRVIRAGGERMDDVALLAVQTC